MLSGKHLTLKSNLNKEIIHVRDCRARWLKACLGKVLDVEVISKS